MENKKEIKAGAFVYVITDEKLEVTNVARNWSVVYDVSHPTYHVLEALLESKNLLPHLDVYATTLYMVSTAIIHPQSLEMVDKAICDAFETIEKPAFMQFANEKDDADSIDIVKTNLDAVSE